MTKQEAIALAETSWWLNATDEQIVGFQLFEPLVCVDFDTFQRALENVLGRLVEMSELAHLDRLQAALQGKVPRLTFQEIYDISKTRGSSK